MRVRPLAYGRAAATTSHGRPQARNPRTGDCTAGLCAGAAPCRQNSLRGKRSTRARETRHCLGRLGPITAAGHFLRPEALTDEVMEKLKALDALADEHDRSLAQLALAWVLRDSRMTSAIIGASSVAQLEDNVAALGESALPPETLTRIDQILGG